MLEKVKKLINYFESFTLDIPDTSAPHIVAEEDQGTTILDKPNISGLQVVIALPIVKLSGNCDGQNTRHTFIIFALDKSNDLSKPQGELTAQYLTVVDLMDAILKKFAEDIAGDGITAGCSFLAGLDIIEIDVMPEAGRFGGWNGWSATITI